VLQLLALIEPLKRGLVATEEDQQAVEAAVQGLEAVNPTKKPLESPLLNGRWELVRDSACFCQQHRSTVTLSGWSPNSLQSHTKLAAQQL
jgi:hypothetical protein